MSSSPTISLLLLIREGGQADLVLLGRPLGQRVGVVAGLGDAGDGQLDDLAAPGIFRQVARGSLLEGPEDHGAIGDRGQQQHPSLRLAVRVIEELPR